MNNADKRNLFQCMDVAVIKLNAMDDIHIKNKDETFYDLVNKYFECFIKIKEAGFLNEYLAKRS